MLAKFQVNYYLRGLFNLPSFRKPSQPAHATFNPAVIKYLIQNADAS